MSDPKPSAALAIVYGLAAIALLTGMDALIKALSPHASTIQIMLLRAAASIAWLAPYMLAARIGPPSRASLPGQELVSTWIAPQAASPGKPAHYCRRTAAAPDP